MRLVQLGVLVLLLEAGWLALWPLSGALSHSTLFTTNFLADHALVRHIFEATVRVAQRLVPNLPDAPLGEPLGGTAYVAPAWALALVFVWLAAAYIGALVLLERGLAGTRGALALVVAGALAFQATLLCLPGLFSQDVFSYIAYGRLATTYDLNPYVWPPSALPKDIVLPWVAAVWRTYAAPYGPIWLDVQWAMARLFGELSFSDQALAYRLLGNALLLANLGLLWAVLGRMAHCERARRTTALTVLAWNPLVLFEVAANAHNDALMVSFSLLALLLFGRTTVGVLSAIGLTLGALVKYLSGLGLVWLALATAARAASPGPRLLRPTLLALVSLAVVLLAAWPWLEMPDSIEPLLAETANVGYVNSLPDSLGLALADGVLSPWFSLSEALAREIVRAVERLLLLAAFGVYLWWELRQVWSMPHALAVARATARSCLVYVLLVSTSVQTWYFCLPVAIVAGLGWSPRLTRVTVGYSLLAPPALYLSYYLREATPLLVWVVYGLAPLLPLLPSPGFRKTRRGDQSSGILSNAAAIKEEPAAGYGPMR